MTSDKSGGGERVHQKARTRWALVVAARQLVADGSSPSVAEVADAAGISRATAYRYFPSQQALLAASTQFLLLGDEKLLTADTLFNRPGAPADVEDRIALVSDTMYDFIREREDHFRRFLPAQMLRGLETAPDKKPMRPAFRMPMIDRALEPIEDELTAAQLRRLKQAIAVLTGPEALIVMRDVLHSEYAAARKDLSWACRALVRAARAEATTSTTKPPPKSAKRASNQKPRETTKASKPATHRARASSEDDDLGFSR